MVLKYGGTDTLTEDRIKELLTFQKSDKLVKVDGEEYGVWNPPAGIKGGD